MLYMTGDGIKIIILETANLEEIRKGRPAKTPDGSVVIAWTPDPVWLADKIADTHGDGAAIARLIDEAAKRPQKPARPHHPHHQRNFYGKQTQAEGGSQEGVEDDAGTVPAD